MEVGNGVSVTKADDGSSQVIDQTGAECSVDWSPSDYSRRSLENRSYFVARLFRATSFESAIQIQSEHTKTSFAGYIAYVMKMAELRANLAKEFFKPIETAITKVQSFNANDARKSGL